PVNMRPIGGTKDFDPRRKSDTRRARHLDDAIVKVNRASYLHVGKDNLFRPPAHLDTVERLASAMDNLWNTGRRAVKSDHPIPRFIGTRIDPGTGDFQMAIVCHDALVLYPSLYHKCSVGCHGDLRVFAEQRLRG